LRLRELNESIDDISDSYFILENLLFFLGIKIEIKVKKPSKKIDRKISKTGIENYNYASKYRSSLAIELLDQLNTLIILDGFDELRNDLKDKALSQIKNISLGFSKSLFILTSRTGDFSYSIDNTQKFEICPLDDSQIELFTKRWIDSEESASNLYQKIKLSPFFDTAMRPLTLSHLCAIYERYGDIPNKPVDVYRKTVKLLIEDWDAQRGIRRQSNYDRFTSERKFDFLCDFAYQLSVVLSKSIFNEIDLEKVYSIIHKKFNLPEYEMDKVVNEIEQHNGLLLNSGFDKYEFSHKSIQEFLTAEYIVKVGGLPELAKHKLEMIPNELAISVAVSSDANIYFIRMFYKFITNLSHKFTRVFLYRLCLEKPDFYEDALLGITFYRLVSKHVKDHTYNENEDVLMNITSLPGIKKSLIVGLKFYNIKNHFNEEFISLTFNYRFKSDIMSISAHELKCPTKFLAIITPNEPHTA